MKNRCDENNFIHCWEDITPNIVYATYPPTYPNKKRRCRNCGRREELVIIQKEIKEWKEVI
jgi:hypothetical protein